MNCNCIKETEAAIRKQLEAPEATSLRPKKAERLAHVEIEGAAFQVSQTMGLEYAFTIPVTLSWMLENGTPKKVKTSIQAGFCPFCGKPADEKKAAKKEAKTA